MGLTARQVRILSNAAIDSMPKYDEDAGQSPSGQEEKPKQMTNEEAEHQRRIHRQILRKRGIKSNNMLAERLRNKSENDIKRPMARKVSAKHGKGKSVDTIEQLVSNASRVSNFKVSEKAKRILQLGGNK